MDRDTATKDAGDGNVPSCESCRKRKLKCGRQQPTCTNCDNFHVDCVYNFERKKPGFKVGAVESLSRRLELVEAALSRQHTLPQHQGDRHNDRSTFEEANLHSHESIHAVFSSLTTELHNLTNAIAANQLRTTHDHTGENAYGSSDLLRKRRRTHATGHDVLTQESPFDDIVRSPDDSAAASSLINHVVDAYFCHIQPWLSIVHEPTFRKLIHEQQMPQRLDIIFQAMVVATAPYTERFPNSKADATSSKRASEARHSVTSTALNTTCIEHVQALLILAYADVLGGTVQRAMSLLAIIIKQLEMLKIHREHSTGIESKNQDGLAAANLDWIGEEEERRVVWNVQILNKLCSALTGYNETVSTIKFSRKLPACASFWYTNRQMITPFLQSHEPVAADASHLGAQQESRSQTPPRHSAQMDPCAWKGSLAFFIEAVEFMGAVFTHLGQILIYTDRGDVSRWLKRFRDIDERLMRWKTELPQQWADSGISRYVLPGVMDPVMTEANALHNTNVILLHERIAYPEPELHFVHLPSTQSAKICLNAAFEVCSIIRKFLQQRKEDYSFGPYFGFCAFISARNLLMYSQGHASPTAEEFWHLIGALESMAQRIGARETREFGSVNIYSRFAGRLRTLHARLQLDPTSSIDIAEPLFCSFVQTAESKERHWVSHEALINMLEHSRKDVILKTPGDRSAYTGLPRNPGNNVELTAHGSRDFARPPYESQYPQQQYWNPSQGQTMPDPVFNDDDLLTISQSLINPDFTGLDRILNFDDMLLAATSEGSTGWSTS